MGRLLQTLLVFCALSTAQPLPAQELPGAQSMTLQTKSPYDHPGSGKELRVAQSDGLTLSQAVEQVRRQYNGRILSAETKRSGDREVHHIKVLTDGGQVKTVKVNGRRLGNRG